MLNSDENTVTVQSPESFGHPKHSHPFSPPPFSEKHYDGPSERYGMPLKQPPHNEPHRPPSVYAIDRSSIKNCVGRNTYIWLKDGSSFWMYPTHVGRKSISGYRYSRRFGWVYYGTDLDNIESFYCAPY